VEKLKTIPELTSEFMGPLVSSMTDEEWAAKDALVSAEAAQDARSAAERRAGVVRGRWLEQGVSERLLRIVLDGELAPTPALLAAREHDEKRKCFLVLTGSPGCGKSTAAAWWIMNGTRGDVPGYMRPMLKLARFITASEFLVMPRFDHGEQEGTQRSLRWASALVLDDLGTEYADARGCFMSDLDALINHRYANFLPTVITTNATQSEFFKRYSERIIDRLRECAEFVGVAKPTLRARPR
jgi:hypothetical protein